MSNPMLQAFFVGRALAATVSERAGHWVSDGLSQLGKFDAEQRENLRQFTEEVMARAEQDRSTAQENGSAENGFASGHSATSPSGANSDTEDLQATIDNLRAEIAQVRAAIQQHRQAP
jgi:polyhydroxyalkanoate synthesis regulator phasin